MTDSESKMYAALSRRYRPPGWALFSHVPNGTGAAKSRTMDALAMSLWPSRGLELFGFEMKASRGDWLKEQREPGKAEETFCYCHRRVLMVLPGVLHDLSEVPPAWGVFELKGGRVYTKREPPPQEPEALDYVLLASILRVAQDGMVPESAVKALADERVEDEVAAAIRSHDRQAGFDIEAETAARSAIKRFEKASGVKMDNWQAGDIGEAVKAVLALQRTSRGHQFGYAARELRRLADSIEDAAEKIKKALE